MKRVVELSIAGDYGATITVRAVVNGVSWQTDMRKLQDALTQRLMMALTDLPVVNVSLGRVRVS